MKGLTINKKFLLIGVFFNIQLAEKEEEKNIKITIKRKSKTREKNEKKKERKNTRLRRRFCNENKIGCYCWADTSWRR